MSKKAEEVEASGGADRVLSLLGEVSRLAKSNAKVLVEVGSHRSVPATS